MSPLFEIYNPAIPADIDQSGQGDDKIRELKRALTERLIRVWTNWPDGDPLTWANLIIPSAAVNFAVGGVPAVSLPAKSVTQALIALLAVGTPELIDLAVTTSKLANLAVTTDKLGAFDGTKLNDNTMPGSKILDASIPSSKYALLSILAAHIANGVIGTVQLEDLGITNGKVADATLEIAKLSVAAKALISITKKVALPFGGGSHGGSDSWKLAGTAVFPGAALGDAVTLGMPNMTAWVTSHRTNTWMAFVDVADSINLIVQNNTGGDKSWPAATINLYITKSAADWGL